MVGAFVFPARAGMSRAGLAKAQFFGCVPRASGDEPRVELGTAKKDACSPRERG